MYIIQNFGHTMEGNYGDYPRSRNVFWTDLMDQKIQDYRTSLCMHQWKLADREFWYSRFWSFWRLGFSTSLMTTNGKIKCVSPIWDIFKMSFLLQNLDFFRPRDC